MTTRQKPEVLVARDEIVAAPADRACNDQTFELPAGLYVAMALLFTGFVAVLSFAFRGHMAVSFGVIFAFLGAFFAIPAMFPHMAREGSKPLSWFEFTDKGVSTATGRTSARDATILVLLLPFLILCFAIGISAIAALI
jgi:hypothetical protein